MYDPNITENTARQARIGQATQAGANEQCAAHCGRLFVQRRGRACLQHERDALRVVMALDDAGLLADHAGRDELDRDDPKESRASAATTS